MMCIKPLYNLYKMHEMITLNVYDNSLSTAWCTHEHFIIYVGPLYVAIVMLFSFIHFQVFSIKRVTDIMDRLNIWFPFYLDFRALFFINFGVYPTQYPHNYVGWTQK